MTLENPSYHLIKELIERGKYIEASELCASLPVSDKTLLYQFWNYLNYPNVIISNDLRNKIDFVITSNQDQTDLYLLALFSRCKYLSDDYIHSDKVRDRITKILEEVDSIVESNNEFKFKEFSFIEIKLYYMYFKGEMLKGLGASPKIILEQLTKGYELAVKYNFLFIKRKLCLWIAITYHGIGNLKLSLEWRKKGLEVSKLLQNDFFIVADLTGIAVVYGWQGNFEKSRKALGQLMTISESHQEPYFQIFYANGFNTLAQLQIMANELEKAKSALEKAISIFKDLKNRKLISENDFKGFTAEVWRFLNELALKSDNFTYSEKCISELDLMKTTERNNNLFKLSKAQYLLKKGRLKDKAEALSLLESIIISSDKYFNITFQGMILLVQLLIEDYQTTKDESIILEINTYITQLESVNESSYLKISLTIIKSKLLLLEGKFDQAEKILNENLETARNLGLLIQEQEITREIEKITREKEEWIRILKEEYVFQEKLKKADLIRYIDEAKKYIR